MTIVAGPLSLTCAHRPVQAMRSSNAVATRGTRLVRDLMRIPSILLLLRGSGNRLVAAASTAALRDERILEVLHVEALVGEEALRVLEARGDLRGRRVDALDGRHGAHPPRHRGGIDPGPATQAREHLLA